MDSVAIIVLKIKTALEVKNPKLPDMMAVSETLVPSVFTLLIHNHKDILLEAQNELQNLSDAEIFENPKIKTALDDSIEKVVDIFSENYSAISLLGAAQSVVKKDIETLLKQDPAFWEKIKDKTYQEILNSIHPGSNEERVFLWLEEVKKGTGIAVNTNESVGEYSVRAIMEFLRSKIK
jgi:predicted transcriptional regulator